MGLFGFGKKKETEKNCCEGTCTAEKEASKVVEKEEYVKVLGSGCAKCNELEANVKKALAQLGMDTAVEHIKDFNVIAEYGVMSTPALVVGGKVVSYGKVLKTEEAVKLLEKIKA